MREIKFRVWDKINNQLYDGSGSLGWTGGYIFQRNGNVSLNSIMGNEDGGLLFLQYTGLKDKNGIEIYENDLLKNPHNETIKVVWVDNKYVYDDLGKTPEGQDNGVADYWFTDCEVIGNIYENPDLLESLNE